jgi:hypothetical protein
MASKSILNSLGLTLLAISVAAVPAHAAPASFKNVNGGVYSTGLNISASALSGGAVDPHYVLHSLPAGCSGVACQEATTVGDLFGPSTYVVLGPNGTFPLVPTAWAVPNDTNSSWIGPRANQTNPITGGTTFPNVEVFAHASSPYVYRMVFNLTGLGLVPDTARLKLRWLSDGGPGSEIRLCPITSVSDPVCAPASAITGSGNAGPLSTLLSPVLIADGVNNADFTSGLMALDFIVVNPAVASGQLNPSGFRVIIDEALADPPSTGPLPLVVTKQFSPSTIVAGGTSTVTVFVRNPNTLLVTSINMTDIFPAGLVLDIPVPTYGGFSGGLGIFTSGAGGNMGVGNAEIGGGVTAFLTSTVSAPAPGTFLNTVGAITGARLDGESVLPDSAPFSATLTATGLPLTVSKVITADTLPLGGSTSMTLTLTNPNAVALTGVGLVDNFPAGLTPSNMVNNCGGSATLIGQTFTLTGGSLLANPAVGHQCTITFTVTGTSLGQFTNTTEAPTATGPFTSVGVPSNPDSVTVFVLAPSITKKFTPASIEVGGGTVVSFVITNPNMVPATNVAVIDTLMGGLIVASTPNVTNTCGGTVTAPGLGTSIALTGASLAANPAAGSSCTVTVALQALKPGTIPNTANLSALIAGGEFTASSTDTLQVGPSTLSFLVRYASNLAVGDSVVNLTNTGSYSSDPGVNGGSAQNGNICANVYAYSPDEQLVSCCSCVVTPNGLNSLSVNNDLASNTLTPIRPSSMVIKLVASAPNAAGSCNAATVTRAGAANFLAPGLEAWGTNLHALPATAGSPAGTYGTTETPFLRATFSDAELTRMTQLCAFIQANGSGYGICKSCKVGGLGAASR